jgi:hypothetical protein
MLVGRLQVAGRYRRQAGAEGRQVLEAGRYWRQARRAGA